MEIQDFLCIVYKSENCVYQHNWGTALHSIGNNLGEDHVCDGLPAAGGR